MKFLGSRRHSTFLTVMFVVLLAPITTKDAQDIRISMSCHLLSSINSKTNGSVAERVPFPITTSAPVYYNNEQTKILPAASPDMINLAREILRKKEAIDFCKSRESLLVQTEGRNECTSVNTTTNRTHVCLKTITIKIKLKDGDVLVDRSKETSIYIAGNTISFLFLLTLLTTYVCFKDLQTPYGRCVVILSILVIFKDIMQLIGYVSSQKSTFCKIIGVTSHWSYLSMFGWTGSIAFDLLVTFSRIRLPSPTEQKQRVRKYVLFSFLVPSLIVFPCVIIDISKTELYALNGVCFISQHMANVLSFTVPVVMVLFFNIVCLAGTIYYIRSANKASQHLWKNDDRRPSISFTVMTVKLSLLLGFGWVIGYIGCLLNSSALLYTYLIMDSFQGMFIYVAFCGNKRVFSFYKRNFNHHLQRIESLSSKRQETEQIDL